MQLCGAFLGGRKLCNLTRMDGMGWALFSGLPHEPRHQTCHSPKRFQTTKNNRRLGSGSNLSSRKQPENESLYIIINNQPPKLPKLYPNNALFFRGKSLKHTTITF